MKTKITAIIFFFLLTAFNSMDELHLRTENNFRLGNEVLISRFQSMLVNKKIGLITNKSGVTQDGKLFLDALIKEFNVTKIHIIIKFNMDFILL